MGCKIPLGQAWETMGNNGLGNLWVARYHWDKLGKQREAMDLVTFGLDTTTGTGLGSNGKQQIGDNFEGGNYFANS